MAEAPFEVMLPIVTACPIDRSEPANLCSVLRRARPRRAEADGMRVGMGESGLPSRCFKINVCSRGSIYLILF